MTDLPTLKSLRQRDDIVALRLYRIAREKLIACDVVQFRNGWTAIDTVLRRASVAGRVEVDGEIKNHFADLLSDNGDLVETVALDSRSYAALKNRWARCKIDRELHP
jgi:hypothetical protein